MSGCKIGKAERDEQGKRSLPPILVSHLHSVLTLGFLIIFLKNLFMYLLERELKYVCENRGRSSAGADSTLNMEPNEGARSQDPEIKS